MSYELRESGDRGNTNHPNFMQPTLAAEQWQNIGTLNHSDISTDAAQSVIDLHFGNVQIFEAPARQAVQPMPPMADAVMRGGSSVKLNVQITNVPEVSAPLKPQEMLQHLNEAFEAGAQAVIPVEKFMAQPNAVSDSLIRIGPALDTAVNYYSSTPADQVVRDAQNVVKQAGDALDRTFSLPHTPEERAKTAGSVMPMFFFDGNVREPIHPETAQQLGLDGLKESKLSDLGILRITRKAGKGGDWPAINERPSPDVVQQARPDGCVAAIGEMLSNGSLKQQNLIAHVSTVPELLAEILGPDWKGAFFDFAQREKALDALTRTGKPWGAELREEFAHRAGMGHMVVVDGLDEAGNLMIRDPQHGTRYEMTREAFLKHWSDRAVYRKDM